MTIYEFTKLDKPYVKLGSGKVKEVFYNEDMNNLMVFDPHRDSNVDEVLGYTAEEHYDFLMDKLNFEQGIIVEWYKCEDATSDYNIHYGLDVKSIAFKPFYEILKVLEESRGSITLSFKFNEIKDGVITPISFMNFEY
ncbi:hypothetical protein [Halobacillus litoralis]|uniref:hypothetical protein n=1 Tax=Halobacillus litoralis TaxID=45668 RepID=UPI002491D52A|nr:hypothetical protein [Halobacillus litoralis]